MPQKRDTEESSNQDSSNDIELPNKTEKKAEKKEQAPSSPKKSPKSPPKSPKAADHTDHPHHMSRTKTGLDPVALHDARDAPIIAEAKNFYGVLFGFEIMIIIAYAVWADYYPDDTSAQSSLKIYGYTRDVNIMIFFGFGFLMTFLRRYAYSAIGYTFLVSAMVAQWSMFLQALADYQTDGRQFLVGVEQIVNGLFCAGAVMISYGALLGKVTPLQMLILAIIEPIFYWVNIYVDINLLQAFDIGGGMTIHTFGAYFGLAACYWLTNSETHNHKDNTNAYASDIFSLAGTLFLWIMWPSFNAAVAPYPVAELRAVTNTFLSISASVLSAFLVSRMLSEHRFDIVHIQNSTLAGGVAMGVAAHLNLQPAAPIGIGFLAGAISVWGYKYLTPLISKRFNIQDVCGVNNLHGMPGILSCLVGILASVNAYKNRATFYPNDFGKLFPQGNNQAAYQTAGLFITLGIALVGGCFTGFIMYISAKGTIHHKDYFNDRTFWNLPSDYEHNIIDKIEDEDALEMQESHHKA